MNFPSTSCLDRQCMHENGRMSQSYIHITRNTFIAKTSRTCNGTAVRRKTKGKGEKNKNKTKKICNQKKKQLNSRESNLDHLHERSAPRPPRHAAKDNVAHLKLNGLLNKMSEIRFLLQEMRFDILGQTETHLNKHTDSGQYLLEDTKWFGQMELMEIHEVVVLCITRSA